MSTNDDIIGLKLWESASTWPNNQVPTADTATITLPASTKAITIIPSSKNLRTKTFESRN